MAPVREASGDGVVGLLRALLCEPAYVPILGALLLAGECLLNLVIVWKVPYTEIDWKAYMDEVEGFKNGTCDYTLLKGDTGPLVYPAGFVYLFLGLYHVTEQGANVLRAQGIFICLYLLTTAIVIRIYQKTKMPPYTLLLLSCFSYRIHSIFVLRLFNDPVAMLFLYVAILFFLNRSWTLGSLTFSLAVSIKMNILLFAPGLLLIYLVELGIVQTIVQLAVCAAPQLVLAIPFLLDNPWGYVSRSFNLGRQFFYIWTVNWKLLPEHVFLDRRFHLVLLCLHLGVLAAFAFWRWTKGPRPAWPLISFNKGVARFTDSRIVLILFTSNFVGMCFARSLHYQFYSWYFHTLPWLVWQTKLPAPIGVGLLLAIEYAWNMYPATPVSSATLHVAHAVLLIALWLSPKFRNIPMKLE
eukprot:m.491972 g.491972  ORF g.491972 m.491972 type:complete len:411 (-) comp31115_c0_seq1:169-1401(-)